MLKVFLECQEISISCRLWRISNFTCYLRRKSDFDWIEWFSVVYCDFLLYQQKISIVQFIFLTSLLSNHWAQKRVKFVTQIPTHFCYLIWQTSAFTKTTSCQTLTMKFDVLPRYLHFLISVWQQWWASKSILLSLISLFCKPFVFFSIDFK